MNTKLTPEQKWEQATLANNFIFYKVMRHHQDACKRLLEMLLNIKIESISMNTEETIALDFDSKGIRLDVFVKDEKRMFDVELQVANTQELRESHIIFICLEDIIENGLPSNTFVSISLEDGKTRLKDRAYKHFFFAPLCAKMIKDEETKAFFEFLISNKASTNYTDELKIYVSDAKQSTENKRQYMEWERQRTYDFEDGKEAGYAEGAQQKAIEAAERLLKMNILSVEQIAEAQGLPIEQVIELKEKLTEKV